MTAKARGSRKGSPFEREIAKILSLWWTDCERDDIFWRTSGSGARAKTRIKSGFHTFGQYGDLQATDPSGQPFIDACCIEMKIGYNKWSALDCLDKSKRAADQTLEKFLEQVTADRNNSGSKWPVLISKRDQRVIIITIPKDMFLAIEDMYGKTDRIFDHIIFSRKIDNEFEEWIMLKLESFLDWCDPAFFTQEGKIE